MAQPKSRRGRSKQGHVRSVWKAKIPVLAECSNCGALKRPHHICPFCGYYNNKPASLKLQTTTQTKEEAKAKAKKAKHDGHEHHEGCNHDHDHHDHDHHDHHKPSSQSVLAETQSGIEANTVITKDAESESADHSESKQQSE